MPLIKLAPIQLFNTPVSAPPPKLDFYDKESIVGAVSSFSTCIVDVIAF